MSFMLISPAAFSEEMIDYCNSPGFTCHEISPNYVVVYPIDSAQPQRGKTRLSNVTYDNTHKRFEGKDGIDVDLTTLSWSAYEGGEMVGSGRISGGKEYCPDIGKNCETVTGTFTIYRKGGEDCKSTRFPVGKGGAPMPYCMFFHGGYALHGSNSVPDYNASHGCVRMSPEDAQWLNEDFVQEGITKVYVHY